MVSNLKSNFPTLSLKGLFSKYFLTFDGANFPVENNFATVRLVACVTRKNEPIFTNASANS